MKPQVEGMWETPQVAVTGETPQAGGTSVYAHLDAIRVSVGQTLRQGAVIGTVGQTGSCFAPCLHYEVRRGDFVQDPVNYFFAELTPENYRDMMIVALTTGQSMD